MILMSACASQYGATEQQVQSMPVNCATAEGDIRMLRSEKVSTEQQIAAGVSTITPIGLLAGAATGTEGTNAQVATGEYNRMIDQKISEIQRKCGVW
jgi:hypothetical protein